MNPETSNLTTLPPSEPTLRDNYEKMFKNYSETKRFARNMFGPLAVVEHRFNDQVEIYIRPHHGEEKLVLGVGKTFARAIEEAMDAWSADGGNLY